MILESFMTEHQIELYEKNGSKLDSTLLADTNTIKKAAIKAAEELEEAKFVIGYKEVWGAKIINPKGKDYVILENGKWTINPKTGKQRSDLEEKLKKNARHQ